MTIELCPYRRTRYECKLDLMQCEKCLKGQIVDAIELQTTAIMNLSVSIDDSHSDKVIDYDHMFEKVT